jgi:hypothetical protein
LRVINDLASAEVFLDDLFVARGPGTTTGYQHTQTHEDGQLIILYHWQIILSDVEPIKIVGVAAPWLAGANDE